MTHGVDGGVSGFGGVRIRRGIRINRIHRGSIVRRAMSVHHRRLDPFPWGAVHGTLRVTHTGEQAGKALRSQGHHYARVM